jgi:hypothetical protein
MLDARRCFFKNLAGAAGAFLFFQSQPPIPGARQKLPINPPEPAEKQDANAPETLSPKVPLHAQEKELRETTDQLFVRVRDLKLELDRLPTSEVFSVSVFKQTQEIEKLAKRLKTYAKG